MLPVIQNLMISISLICLMCSKMSLRGGHNYILPGPDVASRYKITTEKNQWGCICFRGNV